MNLTEWAATWGVPLAAIKDLEQRMGVIDSEFREPELSNVTGEAAVQNHVRLLASKRGWRLWRNNTGVAFDNRGIPIRFGLCNDSSKMNNVLKSSDLIGIDSDGRFIAREVKKPGWTFKGTAREQAQLNFIELVNSLGGDAKSTTGEL
jgi:hypothetical protein